MIGRDDEVREECDSAVEEGTFLTRYGKKVYLIHRRDQFRAQPILVEQMRATGKVDYRLTALPRDVGGEATRLGQGAARLGHETSRLGGDALRRVTTEIERRPLVTVALAVGVGLLIGLGGSLASRRN